MRNSFVKFTEHLRACANCGRGTFLRTSPIDLYCSRCWSGLFSIASNPATHEYPFNVSSLFVWGQLSPQVENLIYSLKGGRLPSAFQKLAEHFVFHLVKDRSEKRRILILPPSTRPDDSDHARAWGIALSEVLGLEVLSPFEFATEVKANEELPDRTLFERLRPQKQLRVNDRFKRQFKLKNGIALRGARITFVDDLITSGATAQAAFKALNSPVDFEVWTIARRPKLAGI